MAMAMRTPKSPTEVEDVSEGDERGEDGSADGGDEVELGEEAAAVGAFEDGPAEPEGDHGEEDVEDAEVEEAVGGELPDRAVSGRLWFEEQRVEQVEGEDWRGVAQQEDEEEDGGIGVDEFAHGAGERGEGDGRGDGTRHESISTQVGRRGWASVQRRPRLSAEEYRLDRFTE
jgi:hypothetical protein